LPISFVTGVVTKPVEYGIAHKYSHFGISFYPHALKHFLRVDAQEITDKFPDLLNFVSTDFNDMILGAGSNHLRISKLNCFLIEQLEKNAYRNGNVVINDVLLNTYKYRNHSVKEVANNYKLSERSIERKFREWVGVSPKKYLQIFRFEETYHKLNGNNFRNLSEVAFANGYSDQSHFIRNFRKFSGIPPSDYIDELKNEERGSGILFWNLTRDASNYKMHELA
jgi:AraC-like DNA-binding protein